MCVYKLPTFIFNIVPSVHIMYTDSLLICRAESATKAKLEKVAEIKRLNAQIMAIKRYI